MYKIINQTIHVIASFTPEGNIIPIKFKFESNSSEIITVKINEIVSTIEPQSAIFNKRIEYVCKGIVYDHMYSFYLQYTVNSHSWTLTKYVY